MIFEDFVIVVVATVIVAIVVAVQQMAIIDWKVMIAKENG